MSTRPKWSSGALARIAVPAAAEVRWYAGGDTVRAAYTLRAEDDDWGQPRTLVREVMDDAARERLGHNIIGLSATA